MFGSFFRNIVGSKPENPEQTYLIHSANTHLARMRALLVEWDRLDPWKGHCGEGQTTEENWHEIFKAPPQNLGEKVDELSGFVEEISKNVKNKKIEKMRDALQKSIVSSNYLIKHEIDGDKKAEYQYELDRMLKQREWLSPKESSEEKLSGQQGEPSVEQLSDSELNCHLSVFEAIANDLVDQHNVKKLFRELVKLVSEAVTLAVEVGEYQGNHALSEKMMARGKDVTRSSSDLTVKSLQEKIMVFKIEIAWLKKIIEEKHQAAVDAVKLPSARMSLTR